MKKFELCYQFNDDTLLVPDLLSKDEPDFPFDEAAALRFRFEYDFLPRSVMPRFIVKMHRDILDDLRWRTGVVLRDQAFRATAVVRVDHEARAIAIAVSGERKREYFAVLRKTLRDLHASFEKLDVKEMVPLPDHPDIAIEYEELLGCEQMKMTEYTVGKLRKRYNVTELLNGIEAETERNRDELQRRLDDLQRKRRYLEQKRDEARDEIGSLDLPDDFRRELTEFLTTLPAIS
ncbi:leucine-rich-repeat protein [Candidatus Moduliflexus flocculans]|uniref:Leucine-rich-repeat protein n=1 Tax=Candidatus Moduliflexus flocculans TaxID=1499966 RepID=A0A0S6VYA4_9BACT|nr:leucine-rich-repeat protein [Candidatus Moduliflexus flocculans]